MMQRYRVRSRTFGMVARRLFGTAYPIKTKTGWRPGSVSDAVMTEALPGLEAIAPGGPCRRPDVRVVEDGGAIWLDLGDATWRAVRVTAGGWQVVQRADVPLIRPEGMRPLPAPVPDPAAMARLRELVNLPGEEHDASFRLTVAWLTAALFPRGPYCVLAIDGEQGSGKSTTARMLRRLVDPNAADLRATPRSEDDLLIAAQNGRVTGFDNVSYLEPDMADALCRVATGAGFGKRKGTSNNSRIAMANSA